MGDRIKEKKMVLACRYCIAEKGLRGSVITDVFILTSLPQNEKEFFDHLESYHHMPIQQDGETKEQCHARFLQKYPEVANCPDCIQSWSTLGWQALR